MQHPFPAMTVSRTRMTPQRMTGLALVALLHVVLISALIMGLRQHFTMPPHTPIIADVIKQTPQQPQPQGPLHFVNPTNSTPLPPPIPSDDSDKGGTITLPPGCGGCNGPVFTDTAARGILSTHTIPAYPVLARRLGQEGTVTLKLSIAPDGSVSDASVESSSGSDELDRAAISWVIAHWRYQPATKNGEAVASTAEAAVVFNLRTARD